MENSRYYRLAPSRRTFFMEKLISSAEFRRRLGISQSTLSRHVKLGIYPCNAYIPVGRKHLYPESIFSDMAKAALNKAEKPLEV